MDHVLLFVTLTLALMGLVMVFSASAIVAGNRFHDPEFFLKRQIAWLGFGVLLMHLTSRIDYQLWKKLSIPILVSVKVSGSDVGSMMAPFAPGMSTTSFSARTRVAIAHITSFML